MMEEEWMREMCKRNFQRRYDEILLKTTLTMLIY
jgi:hypothetical protein